MGIFKKLGEYFNPENNQLPAHLKPSTDPAAIKCISCGGPSHSEWNTCDNCWDEVPKSGKKKVADL